MPDRWSRPTRDEIVNAGITINGLPIMLKRSNYGYVDVEELDVYYEDCVIGGTGAFVIPIRERSEFVKATRTKLILEIAGREPEAKVIPASAAEAARVLHHRRKGVAGPLGRRHGFSLTSLSPFTGRGWRGPVGPSRVRGHLPRA